MSGSPASAKSVPLRTALWMSATSGAVVAVVLGAGILVARAVPWGASVDALTFAGTLKQDGAPVGKQGATLDFSLKKGGREVCALTGVMVMTDEQGAFTARLDTGKCPSPRTLFDGGDLTYGITVNGQALAPDGEVTAVPYAKYADQVGLSDCPPGYENQGSAGPPDSTLCARGADEMVKVGSGAMAFWVDRYEASVWSDAAGTLGKANGVPWGVGADDYPGSFPDNGQWTLPLHAVSRTGVMPSVALTWFQASEACAASGKELLSGVEWSRASKGTRDADPGCWFNVHGGPRYTDTNNNCVSDWGAQDMIGNVWEWTADWHMGVGTAINTTGQWPTTAGGFYGDDGTWNITSSAGEGGGVVQGIPSVAIRGGFWDSGPRAGLFALDVGYGPSGSFTYIGFRCGIRAR